MNVRQGNVSGWSGVEFLLISETDRSNSCIESEQPMEFTRVVSCGEQDGLLALSSTDDVHIELI